MLFWTHFVFSFAVILFFVIFKKESILFFVIALFSSLIPDIDSRNSKIGKNFFSKILTSFSKHRGFFHSLFFVLVASSLFYFIFPKAILPFLIGYISHLFLDCLTKRGLNLFYPFKFRIGGPIRSGSFLEKLIFLSFLLIDIFLVVLFIFSL
jgi:inner membrane protein